MTTTDAAPLEPRPIRVLPDDLQNQIAAGEVVERPASVVKELCENALDSGATRIDVAIESGGIALVSVSDDGSGMDPENLVLSLTRHATSKITALTDLTNLGSFGFRGEALPSIASVSRLVMVSRSRARSEGATIRIEDGGRVVTSPCGAPFGTRVEVRELFYNVPARRKFLRALATESAHVTEVVEAVALGAPDVTVTLDRDGRRVRDLLRAPDREGRVRDVLPGWELIRCQGARGPVRLEAYLSRPEKARLGAQSLRLFVNGRPVRDRGLARSVTHAYGGLLEPGRFPVGVVYVELPGELVDVNVHPQKSEVRFSDTRAVQDAIHRIVEESLGPALTGQLGLGGPGRATSHFATGGADGAGKVRPASEPAGALAEWIGSGALPDRVPYPMHGGHHTPPLSTDGLQTIPPAARFVSQVRLTFLICETDDALLVLDQHAAAERVTFDRLRRAFRSKSVAMQTLLVPEIVDVGRDGTQLIEELGERALTMGVDVRPSGDATVAVHAVPQLLGRASPASLVTSIVSELGRAGPAGFTQALELALATMACHGSIRAGDRVSREEAEALIAALGEIDFGGHCPHGRPILTRLSFRELEHRVGRR